MDASFSASVDLSEAGISFSTCKACRRGTSFAASGSSNWLVVANDSGSIANPGDKDKPTLVGASAGAGLDSTESALAKRVLGEPGKSVWLGLV